jgi:hypothetical protein
MEQFAIPDVSKVFSIRERQSPDWRISAFLLTAFQIES